MALIGPTMVDKEDSVEGVSKLYVEVFNIYIRIFIELAGIVVNFFRELARNM